MICKHNICHKVSNLLGATLLIFLPSHLVFAEPTTQTPLIVIVSGDIANTDEQILLNTEAEFNLPPELVTALHKGVKFIFMADIQILKKRNIWLDQKIVNIQIPRQIQFHSLSRKYIVEDMGLSKRASFNSLKSALKYLGLYKDVEIIKTSFVESSDATYMRMRIRLQRDRLPLPLRLQSYFSLFWSMASSWKVWTL